RDFPIFERDFGGRTLAYLDSAATAQKPRQVIDAVNAYNATYAANVHRGIYAIGEEATAAYEGARATVARFVSAPAPHEIVVVPHLPVDVQALGADMVVFSGHKALGPTGSGALWARRELLEAMPPFLGGGEMIREVHLRRTEYNDVPWKFEAGTPDIAAAIGL